jgi:glycosyltransferase involved in cell wall biosynthesis
VTARTTSARPRLLLVGAYGDDARRGNATTCARYEIAAREAGFEVLRRNGEGPSLTGALQEAAQAFKPDLVHGHHALRVGPSLVALGRPFVVTEGGTEAEFVDAVPAAAETLRDVCGAARAVLLATPASAELWTARGWASASKIRLAPRGVVAPKEPPPRRPPESRGFLRRLLGVDGSAFVVLVVSGLRKGKDPLRALRIYAALAARHPTAACVLIGVAVDPTTAAAVREAAAALPRCVVADPVPFERMRELWADCDVALNTSLYEGVSNALLEAQAFGVAVLAHAIPPNVAATPDAESRFKTDDEAVERLVAWAQSPELLSARGAAGRAFVLKEWSAEREAAAVVAAYREVLA